MSGFSPVDQAVRDRITGDLDANLSVEAGAGTGKTTVLIDRVAAILRAGRASVDQIAVITFTEAAAAELAGRLRQRLEEALETADDGEERARLRDALGNLHRAHIETIHAFAACLLRERPVEAGLDPGFEVLDDLQAELAYGAAYDAWLRGVLSHGSPQIVTAIGRGFGLDQIASLARIVHGHRSLLPLTPEVAAADPVQALIAQMATHADECRRLLPSVGCDEIGAADMEAIVDFAQRLAELRDDPEEMDRAILFNPPKLAPNSGRQGDWDDAQSCRDSKAMRRQARADITAAQEALRTQAIVGVLPLVERFVAAHEAQRKAEGLADYDDLLAWARDMLADSAEARAYFRDRFRVLVVDEFQDTDPVQTDIVLCIASDDDPGDDWLAMTPRPGALTVVGDPKQSIYRFRGADIAIYDAVRRGPLADGQEQMVQNFRSVGGVLGWANRVFDRVLVEQVGVQPANSPLMTGLARLEDESLSVCVLHGTPAGTSAGEVRTEEARLLALQIRQAVEDGWTVRDRATGTERPASWGDVVVLLPRRTQLDTYLDAFRRADLPVRAEGGRSFFQRQEVRDLANLLLAIDDPRDTVSLVACLRATVFGCSDEDIYLHTAAGNALDYRLDHTDSPASVAEAMAVMKDLHDLRSRVSLAQLVRAVLSKTRLIEIALAGWDGQQSAANLVKLADRARAFSASGAGGLRAFAQWLTEKRASSDEAEASIAEETDDVVRVMTIHAAKGLEFPVVALANLHTQARTDIEPVPDRAARRLHVRVLDRGTRFVTPGFDAAWDAEKAQKEAEEKRLLYVAVTRARDHLIVPVPCPQEKAGPMLSALYPSLPALDPQCPEGAQLDGCFVRDGAVLGELPQVEPPLRADAPVEQVDAALAERGAWVQEREAQAAVARAALEVFPATADEGDEPPPGDVSGADDRPLIAGGPTGAATDKGKAMHLALELLDLARPGDVEATVRAACILHGVEAAAGEVRAMVDACLASPVVARARAAEGVWNEVPYTVRVPEGYATGRIDVVFREGDNLVAVDWKSDSVGPTQVQAAAEGHRKQAEAYVQALEATTGLAVSEVVFVFARAGAEWALTPRRTGSPA
jgi:ATP-dependent helicase/nuclease subunit A